jgi:hypothetical protein
VLLAPPNSLSIAIAILYTHNDILYYCCVAILYYIYCCVGRATGSQRSNEDEMTSDLDWNGVIKGVLDLVLRMETDRQETLNKLCKNTQICNATSKLKIL